MRTIKLFIFMLITFGVINAEENQSVDFNDSNQHEEVIMNNSSLLNPTTVTFYSNRAEFHEAYSGVLISEDFSGGPGVEEYSDCGPVVSSNGDDCFPAGELVEGFTITPSESEIVSCFGPYGFFGNINTIVGANLFVEKTVISFEPNAVKAVGMDLSTAGVIGATTVEVMVYGVDDVLLGSFNVMINEATSEAFFGVIADELISKITINGLGSEGQTISEYIVNLEFGLNTLNVVDNEFKDFSYYPNPVKDILSFKSYENINSVAIYNLLGQEILSKSIDAKASSISLSNLNSGAYLMKVIVEGKTKVYKIIKE